MWLGCGWVEWNEVQWSGEKWGVVWWGVVCGEGCGWGVVELSMVEVWSGGV